MNSSYSQYVNLLQSSLGIWKANPRCVICGEALGQNLKTREHVPPQGIFIKPISNSLLTVPCCQDCNNGTSDSDREFKYSLALFCQKDSKYQTKNGKVLFSALVEKMKQNAINPLTHKLKSQLQFHFRNKRKHHLTQWWPEDAHDTVILKIICGLFWLYRRGEIFTDRAYKVVICRDIDFSNNAANQLIGKSYPGINIADGQFIAHHNQSFDTSDSIFSGVFSVSMHFHCDMKFDRGYHSLAYCIPTTTIANNLPTNIFDRLVSKAHMKPGKVAQYEIKQNEISLTLQQLIKA